MLLDHCCRGSLSRAGSVKERLPEFCFVFVNLDDDDETELDQLTEVQDTYFSYSAVPTSQ